MYKVVSILYITCFCLYLLFSRQPDFFDGETTKGIIIKTVEQKKEICYAQFFFDGKEKLRAEVTYPFMFKAGETVTIIFERSNPQKAKVYSLFGYWISFGELFGSIVLLIILFQAAVAITKNPSPEGLISDMESSNTPKRKYDN